MIRKFIKKNALILQIISFYLLTLFIIFAGSLTYLILSFPLSIFAIFLVIFSISYFAPLLTRFFLRSKTYKGKYRNLINSYIKEKPIEINNIYVRKSKSSNAFACSFFKNKSIVYFSNTLEKHPWNEIEAVTAHEIGHHINNDPLLLTFMVALGTTLCSLINFKLHSLTNIKITLIYLPILESLIIYPVFLSIERYRESLADKYAYKVLKNPKPFADFFKKLIIISEKEGIKVNKNPNYFSKIFFTHPPIYERIAMFENKK